MSEISTFGIPTIIGALRAQWALPRAFLTRVTSSTERFMRAGRRDRSLRLPQRRRSNRI